MRIILLFLIILAAISFYYIHNQQLLPQITKTPEEAPQTITGKQEYIDQKSVTEKNIEPIIQTFDFNWFSSLISDTSKACVFALSSDKNEFQDIQNKIALLRNATNKSKALSIHLDVRTEILRLYGRASFALNDLLQYRKRFNNINYQTPTALDSYKTSIDQWRLLRKKQTETEWSNKKRAIETEINNIKNQLLIISKSKNFKFNADDPFVIAAENLNDIAKNIISSHEKAEAEKELEKISKHQNIEVIQVISKGILADQLKSINTSSTLTQMGGGGGGSYSYYRSGRNVYIDGISGMAEGQRVLISYIEDGTYTFVDINGSNRTIPKWKYIRTVDKLN